MMITHSSKFIYHAMNEQHINKGEENLILIQL